MVTATTDARVGQPTDFRVGSVFGHTCLVFARNLMKFSVVTGLATLPWLLTLPNSKTPIIDLHLPPVAVILIVVFSIVFSQAIVVLGAFQDLRGRPVSLINSLRISLRRFFPILALGLCAALVLVALAPNAEALFDNPGSSSANVWLIFVIAGVGLLIVWFVAIPVCVIEELNPFPSLRRSRELTKSHRLKIFALTALTIIAGIIMFLIMRAIVGVILIIGVPAPAMSAAVAAALIWIAIWSAFFDVLLAVIYHNLRLAKEGVYVDGIATVFE